MSRFTMKTRVVVAFLSMSIMVAACGTGTESGAENGRNAAVVAGTACKKAGRYTTVSKQKVVCGSRISGKVWYRVGSVKKTKCAKAGAIRKNRGVAFVCGVTKTGRFWISTKAMPAAPAAPVTPAQTVAFLEQTDIAAAVSVTDAPAPEDVVRIMPVRDDAGAPTAVAGASVTTVAPAVLPKLEELSVASVAAGSWASCAVLYSNEIRCWGDNSLGQLGNASVVSSSRPVRNKIFDGKTRLASMVVTSWGESFCALATDGSVWCWGANDSGQLGDGTYSPSASAVQVKGLDGVSKKITSIVAGSGQYCAIDSAHDAWCWGAGGDVGRFGKRDVMPANYNKPTGIAGMMAGNVYDLAIAGSAACSIDSRGNVNCWGNNSHGLMGPNHPVSAAPLNIERVANTGPTGFAAMDVVANASSMCISNSKGELRCWGIGNATGTKINDLVKSPTVVVGFDSVTHKGGRMWAGGLGTCALDIVLNYPMCWGYLPMTADGQGATDVVPRRFVEATAPNLRFVSGAISMTNTYIVTTEGKVYAHGQNWAGQLGNGTIDTSVPS